MSAPNYTHGEEEVTEESECDCSFSTNRPAPLPNAEIRGRGRPPKQLSDEHTADELMDCHDEEGEQQQLQQEEPIIEAPLPLADLRRFHGAVFNYLLRSGKWKKIMDNLESFRKRDQKLVDKFGSLFIFRVDGNSAASCATIKKVLTPGKQVKLGLYVEGLKLFVSRVEQQYDPVRRDPTLPPDRFLSDLADQVSTLYGKTFSALKLRSGFLQLVNSSVGKISLQLTAVRDPNCPATTCTSLIEDESARELMKTWVDCANAASGSNVGIQDFRAFIYNLFLEQINVCPTTAKRWLQRLGCTFGEENAQQTYIDGHERPDVQRRRAEYVREILELRQRSMIYYGDARDEMDKALEPILQSSERPVEFSAHDEACCRTKETRRRSWKNKDGTKMMQGSAATNSSGDSGDLVHVSLYMSETYGKQD